MLLTLFIAAMAGCLAWISFQKKQILETVFAFTANALVTVREKERLNPDECEDKIKVCFAGTGFPASRRGRANQCIWVSAGGSHILFDCGARATANLIEYAVPLDRITAVFISHYHSDHISGLGELMLQSWVAGRKEKLKIYGGPGIHNLVDGLNSQYKMDFEYRIAHHSEKLMPREAAGCVAVEFETCDKWEFEGGLCLECFAVEHCPVEPAYGFKLKFHDRSVVISGDTTICETVLVAAQDCDLLIHEAMAKELISILVNAWKNKNDRMSQLLEDIEDYHSDVTEVIALAESARVKHLALIHCAPGPDNPAIKRWFQMHKSSMPSRLLEDDDMYILPINSDEIIVGNSTEGRATPSLTFALKSCCCT